MREWEAAKDQRSSRLQTSQGRNCLFCKGNSAGAQPALHFGVGNFHEISFDDAIMLTQPWYNVFANGHR